MKKVKENEENSVVQEKSIIKGSNRNIRRKKIKEYETNLMLIPHSNCQSKFLVKDKDDQHALRELNLYVCLLQKQYRLQRFVLFENQGVWAILSVNNLKKANAVIVMLE